VSTYGRSANFHDPKTSSALPSGRIYAGTAAAQRPSPGFGYVFSGTSGVGYWDDSGFWQADPTGLFNPASIVAVAPVAGRYHYHFHGEFKVVSGSGAVMSSHPQIFVVSSSMPTTTHMGSHSASNNPETAFDADWEGYLGAGQVVGIQTIITSSPSNDQFNDATASYQFIQQIG
jgi:hypothetical protein